ncbi:MAG: SMP-30/gluconolactonase/LRE family protein [Alphaproteobacteria bacterium]|jgi:sugar lactone lactonase YvrE|nr:SMP-30/gluconolactonase/LRE family protein [Alphaproteobacteria bacterium]
MEEANILKVIEAGAILGESPVWSVDEQVLYWLDIKAPSLHRYDPASGKDEAWPVAQEIGSIALRAGGGLVGALRDGFAYLTPGEDRLEWIGNPEPGRPESRLNDGRVDRQGRFWAGSMHDPEGPPQSYFEREPVGAFYRLDGDGSIHRMIEGILVSNGLCWSPDGTRMYAADSPTRTIRTWSYDPETGNICDEQVFVTIPEEPDRGTPDGATVDAEGGVWIAEFRGSRITRFYPDGTEDRMIELPVSSPTCPMFGGLDLRTLYVTSAKIMLSPDELGREPLAGALFALDVGIAGLPEAACPL